MGAGRPTTYDAIKVAKAVVAYVKKRQQQHFLPTIEGLAVHIEVARATLYEWASEHPEFSDILEQLKAAQADQLIQNGLVGHFNATITKLMLTKHGYVDKQDVTSDGKALPTPILGGVTKGDVPTDNSAEEGSRP
jgi:hypothetical protein